MATSSTKQVQTMVNVVAQQMELIRSAVDKMKTVRTAYQAINPDVTGTPLEGNVVALNQSLNNIDTEVQQAVWDTLINGVVESHRNQALED